MEFLELIAKPLKSCQCYTIYIAASSSKSESAPNNTGPTIAGNDDQVGGGRGNELLLATPQASQGQQNEENNEQQINTLLRVPPSGYGGAVPRRPISRDSSAESSEGSSTASSNDTKTCFCGHYTEVQNTHFYAVSYILHRKTICNT